MRRSTLFLAVAALALCAPMAVSITGCTVAMYKLGGVWDRHHPQSDREMDPSLVAQLKPGEPCGVVLADSTVIRGVYLGLVPRAAGEDLRTPRRIRIGTYGDTRKLEWSDLRLTQRGITSMGTEPTATQLVNSADVKVILLPGGHPGQQLGALVGFTADAVILISLTHHRSAPDPGCQLPSNIWWGYGL